MMERRYENFDVIIEQSGDKYRARVVSSPAGQATAEFDKPFSALELENFVLRMGRPRSGMRRIDSPEMKAAKDIGMQMFTTIFSGEVNSCYLRSIDNVLSKNRGLRIRLHINAPEFNDYPWEFLYNPQFGQFVALSHNTPIVRYLELPYTTRALPVQTPLKILVMISSPQGFPQLDVEKEWEKLNQALKPMLDQGLMVLEKLESPTLSALQKHLRQNQVHIFHYIGHGKYFENKQDGTLLLEDEHQLGKPTSGQHLGAILHDHYHLRLVVLNACEGARTSAEDPYAGVAQTLVRQGISAVLAMQFEIFEDAAMTFAEEFYSAIVDNYPVDAALSEARKAIFAGDNDVEWGTPVLFMRTPNGVLFRPETPAEKAARLAAERLAAEKAAREKAEREAEEKRLLEQRISLLNRLYDEAKQYVGKKHWPEASESLAKVLEIEPDFRDAVSLLEQVETERVRAEQVMGFITQGKGMIQKGNWSEAVQIFQQLLALSPGHDEASHLLAEAEAQIKREQKLQERQKRLDALYEQANTKVAEQNWTDAIKLFEEIEQIEPGFRDIKSLLKQTKTQKDLQEKVASLISRGKEHLGKKEWIKAISTFQQALELDSDNTEVQALKAEANRGEKVKELLDLARKHVIAEQWHEAINNFQTVLELEPTHDEAKARLADAEAKLARSRDEEQSKNSPLLERQIPNFLKPSAPPEEIKPLKPTSLPEEIKPFR